MTKSGYNDTAGETEGAHINASDSNTVSQKLLADAAQSNGPPPPTKPGVYPWIVLVIITLMSICNQWQRYAIGYVYGYKGDGDKHLNPKYEIKVDYPQIVDDYGTLAGAAFSLTYAFLGIFGGVLSDNVNRKVLAGISCILWSCTTLLSGIVDSFTLFFVLRCFLGVFEAGYNPAAYGLISDYFHPNYRATVNSLYNGAIYLGGALSSLAIIMITAVGWRTTYVLIGVTGIVSGCLGLFFILEPKRGRFEAPKPKSTDERSTLRKFADAAKECAVNPTPRYITLAAISRYFAGYAIGYYMPSYFQQNWVDKKTQYSSLNAIVVSLCGFMSALLGGLISDHYSKKGLHMSKAYVCIGGSLLGIPTILLCTLSNDNFYLAMFGLALEYFFAECWIGPAITMVIDTISPENKGFAVSAFLFSATISGTISSTLLGKVNIHRGAAENPSIYGQNLAFWVSISYAVSCPFFWIAGKHYTAKKVRDEVAARQAQMLAADAQSQEQN